MLSSPARLVLSALLLAAVLALGWLWQSSGNRAELGAAAGFAPAPAGETSRVQAHAGGPAVARGRQNLASEAARVSIPSAPTRIRGRVLRARNRSPIAGAEIELSRGIGDQIAHLDPGLEGEIEVLASLRSDDQGRFEFSAAPGIRYRLQARAVGLAPRSLVGCRAGQELEVLLSAGARVRGRILRDADGQPVPGCRIRVSERGRVAALGTGQSDAQGRFDFADLPPVSIYLQCRDGRAAPVWQSVDLRPGATTEIEIRLGPEQMLRGVVVDKVTGKPIAGAELSSSWQFAESRFSDAQGRFEIGGFLTEMGPALSVRKSGFASANLRFTNPPPVELRVELRPGGQVRGQLRLAEGGLPKRPYVALVAMDQRSGRAPACDWIRAEVSPTGQFEARGLDPQLHYWVFARAAACGSRHYALPAKVASSVAMELPEIILEPEARILGKVEDERGQAAVGMPVAVSGRCADRLSWLSGADGQDPPLEVPFLQPRQQRTDQQGRFLFAGLGAGRFELRTMLHAPTLIQRQELGLAAGARAKVRLQVQGGLRISGRIGYHDGRALTAGSLRLLAEGGDGSRRFCFVARDGAFVFEDLPPGAYRLRLFSKSGHQGWLLPPMARVMAGQEPIQWWMVAAARLSGQVLDSGGQPVSAQVWAVQDGTDISGMLVRSDPVGRFVLEVVPGFRGEVRASTTGAGRARLAVQRGILAGDQGLRLQLR